MRQHGGLVGGFVFGVYMRTCQPVHYMATLPSSTGLPGARHRDIKALGLRSHRQDWSAVTRADGQGVPKDWATAVPVQRTVVLVIGAVRG